MALQKILPSVFSLSLVLIVFPVSAREKRSTNESKYFSPTIHFYQLQQKPTDNIRADNKIVDRIDDVSQIRSVAFIGNNFAWLVTLGGDLWRSQDGGVTWEQLSHWQDVHFICVAFINKDEGWAVSAGAYLLHTENGGKQWQQRAKLNYPQYNLVADGISFVDNLHGWLAANPDYIWRTEDGGRSWQLFTNWQDGRCNTIYRMKFFSSKVGWITCGLGTMFCTEDGGKNWKIVQIGGHFIKTVNINILDIFFVNRTTGWRAIHGPRSIHISKTTDGGRSWQKQFPLSRAGVQSLFFLNEQLGWAVGEGPRGASNELKGAVFWQVSCETECA